MQVTFRMMTSDLLAVFRARITYWCVHTAKKDETINKDSLAALKPPFRLISLGHELTPDLDMKTMGELGVRDQQVCIEGLLPRTFFRHFDLSCDQLQYKSIEQSRYLFGGNG